MQVIVYLALYMQSIINICPNYLSGGINCILERIFQFYKYCLQRYLQFSIFYILHRLNLKFLRCKVQTTLHHHHHCGRKLTDIKSTLLRSIFWRNKKTVTMACLWLKSHTVWRPVFALEVDKEKTKGATVFRARSVNGAKQCGRTNAWLLAVCNVTVRRTDIIGS